MRHLSALCTITIACVLSDVGTRHVAVFTSICSKDAECARGPAVGAPVTQLPRDFKVNSERDRRDIKTSYRLSPNKYRRKMPQ